MEGPPPQVPLPGKAQDQRHHNPGPLCGSPSLDLITALVSRWDSTGVLNTRAGHFITVKSNQTRVSLTGNSALSILAGTRARRRPALLGAVLVAPCPFSFAGGIHPTPNSNPFGTWSPPILSLSPIPARACWAPWYQGVSHEPL